jgi:hypothetical protein
MCWVRLVKSYKVLEGGLIHVPYMTWGVTRPEVEPKVVKK